MTVLFASVNKAGGDRSSSNRHVSPMSILIIEQHGRRRGTRLLRRLLIGRRKANHVVIDVRTVSIVHAWIDKQGDECILTDTGSRLGTFVNGKRITRPL